MPDLPPIPEFREDDFVSASALEALRRTAQAAAAASLGGALDGGAKPDPRAGMRVFRARVTETPGTNEDGTAGAAYDDYRYWVVSVEPTADTDSPESELTVEDDQFPGVGRYVTAFNLAEITVTVEDDDSLTVESSGHSVTEGQLVTVISYPSRSNPGRRLYFFSHAAGSTLVRAKVTGTTLGGTALGGGKYAGRILTGTSTIAANSTDLTMPEGLTVPGADDCMIVNIAESGSSAHSLTDSGNAAPYVMGFIDGSVTVSGTTYDVLWVDATRLYTGCT